MISAGNDIVALKAIDKGRTCLPAFYSKFITPAELLLHNPNQISFENFVWLLWSVKESAYKYLKRGDAGLIFSPSALIINEITVADTLEVVKFDTDQSVGFFYTGSVAFINGTLRFQSVLNTDFICSIIREGSVCWGIKAIQSIDHKGQSEAVRVFALEKLADHLNLDNLEIKKHNVGYPVLFDGSIEVDIAISFSHHDRYVSYAFQIPK